ncbi:MAG: DUF4190 domain-containing protein [bacterium]|nr:DUF4190 domain-containing protein [bacterium]
MSEYPNAYGNPDVQLYQEPERTSIMAILSLVMSLLGCCVFITAPIGVLLGIFGLIGTSKSNGRVGGKGLAIGGIIVGVLAMAIWAGIVFGFGGMMNVAIKQFGSTTESILSDIQSGDYDAARANMAGPGSITSDEDLAAFNAAYTADLGSYVSMPSGFGEMINGYMALGPLMQPYQNQGGYVPMPAQFDSGWVLVLYVMDPGGQGPVGANGMPLPEGLILIGADGTEYSIPLGSGSTSWPGTGSVPDAGDSDADSDEDSATPDEESAEEEGTEEPDEGP